MWVIISAILVLIAGVITLQARSLNKTLQPTNRTDAGQSWGPVGAPVRIVEYSNYLCPACRQFALTTGTQLRNEYESTGKVRFEFKFLRLGHPGEDEPANAAFCAADQGRFFDYHDQLFNKQGTSANPFTKPVLQQIGAQLELDAARFNRCVDNGEHKDLVAQDTSVGLSQGVDSTPTFFINGQRLVGALPFDQMKAKIDPILKASP